MDLAAVKRSDERWILSCDGGGIRGIITLRCLEALEQCLQARCLDIFDMFAGTSTGAIIAGFLASGKKQVSDLIGLYRDRRSEVFAGALGGFLHPLVTKYRKRPLHHLLREQLGEIALEQCERDILITATDTVRSETIYFTAFRPPQGPCYGTYRAVRLRHAIEASASAPTYFPPHGRFVDGGVGVHNNPCYMAAVEALRYSADRARKQRSWYEGGKIRVLSFGTGAQIGAMEPGEALTKPSLGWVKYIIAEGMGQANSQQSYICRSELDAAEHAVAFHRYDVFLTREVLATAGVPPQIDPDMLALD